MYAPLPICTSAAWTLSAFASACYSADTPALPKDRTVESAAPANPLLPGWLKVGGQVRGRFDEPQGIGYNPDVSNGYYVERIRLDVMVRPVAQLRLYLQAQDSRAWGYDNRATLNSVHNPVDLRQGYIDYLSNESRGVQMRFGRQNIRLGSGRLVDSPDWSNVSRTYDAARLALFRPGVRLDLIAGSPVLIDQSRLDRHKPGEHLYVSYLSLTKLVPGSNLQPYVLARTSVNAVPEIGVAGDAHLYTAGVRFEGKLQARLEYAVEVAKQWGPWSGDRVSAVGGMYSLGWTVWPRGGSPG